MKYRVVVNEITETVKGLDGEDEITALNEVYAQTVDGESFDLAALIRAVNTKKRGPRVRAKKGEA